MSKTPPSQQKKIEFTPIPPSRTLCNYGDCDHMATYDLGCCFSCGDHLHDLIRSHDRSKSFVQNGKFVPEVQQYD